MERAKERPEDRNVPKQKRAEWSRRRSGGVMERAKERPKAATPKNGAEAQSRTGDTSIFSAVLYQLSYLGTALVEWQNPNNIRSKSRLQKRLVPAIEFWYFARRPGKAPAKKALVLAIEIWYFPASATWSDRPRHHRDIRQTGMPSSPGRPSRGGDRSRAGSGRTRWRLQPASSWSTACSASAA
jgi:hypothetical protein